jgi:ABC transporter ATM
MNYIARNPVRVAQRLPSLLKVRPPAFPSYQPPVGFCQRRSIHELYRKTLPVNEATFKGSGLPWNACRARLFGNMAGPKEPPKPEQPKSEPKLLPDNPTRAEQRRTDWTIIKRLLTNVWPKNDWKTRGTVLFGFMLLVSAKVRRSNLVPAQMIT